MAEVVLKVKAANERRAQAAAEEELARLYAGLAAQVEGGQVCVYVCVCVCVCVCVNVCVCMCVRMCVAVCVYIV